MKKQDELNLLRKIERLYHFTKFDTAIKILLSKALRYGEISHMNDLEESKRCLMYIHNKKAKWTYEELDDEYNRYVQLSFTKDINANHLGFENLPMWGHYAGNGEGLCFVFDKKFFIDNCYARDVRYDKKYVPFNILLNQGDGTESAKELIEKNIDGLFFHKASEWKYENEYRVIYRGAKDLNEYFPINEKMVRGIIFCANWYNDAKKMENINNFIYPLADGLGIPLFEYNRQLDLASKSLETKGWGCINPYPNKYQKHENS